MMSAPLPTITLPGPIIFKGVTLAMSTYPSKEEFTLASGTRTNLPPGMSIFFEGPSPLSVICPGDSVVTFSFQSPTQLSFAFPCPGISLTLLDGPPVRLPSINFIRFQSIGVYADVGPDALEFGLSTDFLLATGDSRCASVTDAECIQATVTAGILVDTLGAAVTMGLESEGASI